MSTIGSANDTIVGISSGGQPGTGSTMSQNGTFTVPAGHIISDIAYENTTANAVTGGIKVGTTNGGTEVIAAQAIGANAIGCVADASILKKYFSSSSDTTLYVQAVSSWNSAVVNFIFALRKVV